MLSATVILVSISVRLFWIQVVDTSSYSEHSLDLTTQSVLQRAQILTLDDGRADFVDRHDKALTGETIHALAVFPHAASQITNNEREQLLNILHISEAVWKPYSELKEAKIWTDQQSGMPVSLSEDQVRRIADLQLKGIYVIPYKQRYATSYAAAHLIGFIGQYPERLQKLYPSEVKSKKYLLNRLIGEAGLEKTLDDLLQGVDSTTLMHFQDASNRPLKGLDIRIRQSDNPFYPLKVVTTLDLNIQQQLEKLADQHDMKQGSIVVLDTHNADIIAMVSRPNYDPYDVDPQRTDWNNKALQATEPGSIFKTVIAAAALDEGWAMPREKFQCNGALGKYHFSCWKKDGHASLSFEQAFAQSCNITFAKIAERMPAQSIERYAAKLGLLQPVGWSSNTAVSGKQIVQLDREDAGQVFAQTTSKHDVGVKMQTAIGQRDVRLSPLQAANMIVSLLNGGKVYQPRAVKEIRYQNNGLRIAFPIGTLISKRDGLTEHTSHQLLHWMEQVVQVGTGRSLQQADWNLAGKSGTAQIRLEGAAGENHWFIGYGPTNKPQYAVAVLVQEEGSPSNHLAMPIFREVMNVLKDHSEKPA